MAMRGRRLLLITALLVAGCGGTTATETTTAPGTPKSADFTVVSRHHHDPAAFTQGLVVHDGTLLEGTGLVGKSELRRVDIASGRVIERRALPADFFGEGVAVHGDRVFQLTWRNGVGLIWDDEDLTGAGRWTYTGEGWGLTTMGDELVMSDGTDVLKVIDPRTREVTRQIDVTREGLPQDQLNELEYIGDGRIAANVWMTPTIVVIDVASGAVTHVVDLTELAAEQPATAMEMNGIAVDPGTGNWYVTGKNWSTLYEIDPQLS